MEKNEGFQKKDDVLKDEKSLDFEFDDSGENAKDDMEKDVSSDDDIIELVDIIEDEGSNKEADMSVEEDGFQFEEKDPDEEDSTEDLSDGLESDIDNVLAEMDDGESKDTAGQNILSDVDDEDAEDEMVLELDDKAVDLSGMEKESTDSDIVDPVDKAEAQPDATEDNAPEQGETPLFEEKDPYEKNGTEDFSDDLESDIDNVLADIEDSLSDDVLKDTVEQNALNDTDDKGTEDEMVLEFEEDDAVNLSGMEDTPVLSEVMGEKNDNEVSDIFVSDSGSSSADEKEDTSPAFDSEKTLTTGISEERLETVITQVVEKVVERVARETMSSVAERLISEAIESLKQSLK